MKKLALCIMATCLSLTFVPFATTASESAWASSLVVSDQAKSAEAKALVLRLEEIRVTDKSGLTSPEKKKLRNEVRSIKKELNGLGDGLYISAGALIIIIILLIILL